VFNKVTFSTKKKPNKHKRENARRRERERTNSMEENGREREKRPERERKERRGGGSPLKFTLCFSKKKRREGSKAVLRERETRNVE